VLISKTRIILCLAIKNKLNVSGKKGKQSNKNPVFHKLVSGFQGKFKQLEAN
jgi:hypothetical protein